MQINVKTKHFLTYFNKKIGNYILLDTEHTKILSLLTVFFFFERDIYNKNTRL